MSPELRRILLEAWVILLFGAGLGLTINHRLVSDLLEGRSPFPPQEASTMGAAVEAVTLEELDALLAQGALAVDARITELFAEGHLPGAQSLPWAELEETLADFLRTVPRSTRLVTYCSGEGCPDSIDLAHRLRQEGYARVSVFEGGFPAWREAGRPVEEGRP